MPDQLRNKIQQWEASPPHDAWSFIADALQEVNAENKLAGRLAQHEEIPPSEIWVEVLEQVQPKDKREAPLAPVIPMQPLYPYLFRYGSVAILIGLVAWLITGNPFWQKPEQSNQENISANSVNTNQPAAVTQPSLATALTGNPEIKTETVQQETVHLSNDLPAREPQYSVVNTPKYPTKETVTTRQMPAFLQPSAFTLQELPVQKRNQRYIFINTSTGEPVRLSAKFAPIYYALEHGTENNTLNIAESFQKMQQQMSRRPYIPDPNNHFDIIRLVDLLQQEQ